MNRLYRMMEWITRMAYLNILWLSFTILGLVILGLFPATNAMFAIVRKWIIGETDIPVFKTFWKIYKQEFVKSNMLGYLVSSVGYILYMDFVILNASTSNLVNLLNIPILLLSLIYLLTMFYIFPIFVHYDMKLFQVVKAAFFMMILNPLATFIMLLGSVSTYYIMINLQGLIPIFSGSVLALIIMMPAQHAFQKLNKKQQVYQGADHP